VKFKRQSREGVEVNLTSLIDVVFLLLIFFMVSTTFTKQSHLTVDLPKATGQTTADKVEQIEIVIDRNGQYTVNERSLVNNQLETLKRAIQTLSNGNSSLPLIITADANAAHQHVVRAMDAAGQLGFVHLSITTEKPDPEP
jgi:biopolymer transport protein ExbD